MRARPGWPQARAARALPHPSASTPAGGRRNGPEVLPASCSMPGPSTAERRLLVYHSGSRGASTWQGQTVRRLWHRFMSDWPVAELATYWLRSLPGRGGGAQEEAAQRRSLERRLRGVEAQLGPPLASSQPARGYRMRSPSVCDLSQRPRSAPPLPVGQNVL
jgi:hypothetical protein